MVRTANSRSRYTGKWVGGGNLGGTGKSLKKGRMADLKVEGVVMGK